MSQFDSRYDVALSYSRDDLECAHAIAGACRNMAREAAVQLLTIGTLAFTGNLETRSRAAPDLPRSYHRRATSRRDRPYPDPHPQ